MEIEAMLNYPQVDPTHPILNSYPMDLQLITKYQQLDQALMKAVKENNNFKLIHIYGNNLVIYQITRSNKQSINIPHQLQSPAVRWLHGILGHAGVIRLTEPRAPTSGSHA